MEIAGLRRATVEDADAMRTLAERAYFEWIGVIGAIPQAIEVSYPEVLERDECWICGGHGRTDASLVLQHKPDHLLLWALAVHPDAAGLGIGTALLNFAETRAQAAGYSEIRLFTNVLMQSNRDWYKRSGFQEIGEEAMGDKRVVMMRKPV